MIAARLPIQRHVQAKLLVIRNNGKLQHWPRSKLIDLFEPGDLVIANDAATIPASLVGTHAATGRAIEVRLAGRRSLDPDDIRQFSAVVFGAGDFHMRTEDRPEPPPLSPGDRLILGPLRAAVQNELGHPRLVLVEFEGSPDEIREGLGLHGRPIQYAHIQTPLALWDVWTPIAGPPAAFEPPSAGFALDWHAITLMAERGIGFATITHAAGISSTGDPELDKHLPFDEPYRISESTACAIERAQTGGGRVIAIGTTVVRALEHAATSTGRIRPGDGIATGRIGASTPLSVVDAILSGTHDPGTSHYELLRAFIGDEMLRRADYELNTRGYRTHEFGDSVFIERDDRRVHDILHAGRARGSICERSLYRF